MWTLLTAPIFFSLFYNCAASKTPLCIGVTYTDVLLDCTTNEKIFTRSFDLDVSRSDNASYPNRLNFSNFNTWSLNNSMYFQSGPMSWKYVNTYFTNPSMNNAYSIDYLDNAGSYFYPFSIQKPTFGYQGYVDDVILMFIDKGKIFEAQHGYLFNPDNNPCFNDVDGDGCFEKNPFASFIRNTTVCCKKYVYVELPNNNEGYCDEIETTAKLTNSDGLELIDFSAHSIIYESQMNIAVTKFSSIYNYSEYIYPITYIRGLRCSGNVSNPFSNCIHALPSGDFQFDMLLDLYSYQNINEFESIVGQVIRHNGKIYHSDNIPYSPANPCYNRTTFSSTNSGLTVKSSTCCTKFGAPINPPSTISPVTSPIPSTFCVKYSSLTTLSNNAASLQVEYQISNDVINVAVEYCAKNFSTLYFEAYSTDLFSDICVASTENPKSNCTFTLSQTQQYELQFRTSLYPDGFNMLQVTESNNQFIVPYLTPSQPCYIESNPYNYGNPNLYATTKFCCQVFG